MRPLRAPFDRQALAAEQMDAAAAAAADVILAMVAAVRVTATWPLDRQRNEAARLPEVQAAVRAIGEGDGFQLYTGGYYSPAWVILNRPNCRFSVRGHGIILNGAERTWAGHIGYWLRMAAETRAKTFKPDGPHATALDIVRGWEGRCAIPRP